MGLIMFAFAYAICTIGTFLFVHEEGESKKDLKASFACSVLWPMFWSAALMILIGLVIIAMMLVLTFIFNGIWKLAKMIIGTFVAKKDVQN